VTGSHFIAVKKHFDLLDPNSLATGGDDRYTFLEALPELIVHSKAMKLSEVIGVAKKR
jgi:hypothetical protein